MHQRIFISSDISLVMAMNAIASANYFNGAITLKFWAGLFKA